MITANRARRRGYTLMEICVVLAIIIIVAGISVPVVQFMLEDARSSAATDMIRGKAAETRANAMDSGRPWRFAYLPGTGVFQLAPDDSTDWEGSDAGLVATLTLIRDELPIDIIFGGSPSDIQSGGASGDGWQTIAVYTYDGSAREDTITYYGKTGTPAMAMEVRALTGSVTMRNVAEVRAMQP
jgi:type II secretory pathway pseudopilin PulG